MNRLAEFQITPMPESKSFRFRLRFDGKSQQVEFVASFEAAMYLLKHLQRFQVRYKLPIPLRERPRGKPVLSVVRDDDEKKP